jgi:bifunctional non-homologous end joining protein LigD
MPAKSRTLQAAKTRAKRQTPIDFSTVPLARKAPLIKYSPQLATLVQSVPAGPGWLYEAKFDGYRLMAHREGDRVQLLSRRGLDWSGRFKTIVEALRSIPLASFVIDGEACALDKQGQPSFQLLQGSMERGTTAPMAYFVFDLLYADGYDLAGLPLIERKQLLERVVGKAAENPRVQLSPYYLAEGAEILSRVCHMGLEGVICKRAQGAHSPVRTREWLKVKCLHRQGARCHRVVDAIGVPAAFRIVAARRLSRWQAGLCGAGWNGL